jgi:hypothetical protein
MFKQDSLQPTMKIALEEDTKFVRLTLEGGQEWFLSRPVFWRKYAGFADGRLNGDMTVDQLVGAGWSMHVPATGDGHFAGMRKTEDSEYTNRFGQPAEVDD